MAQAVIGALRVNLAMDSAQFQSGVGAANRGLDTLAAHGRKVGQQFNTMRMQTSNLAAQFSDVGVQLAGGQSPFLIALQQGTQINQALGGAGLRGTVAALGGAFASLLNPVSLVTIALIGAGGTAVQYFSSLLSDGEKSAETLKKQASLIQAVAAEWGAAVPALQAYAAEVERAQKVSELREATTTAIEQMWEGPKAQVKELTDDVEKLTFLLQFSKPVEIDELNRAFNDLRRKIEDGNATAEDAQAVLDALNSIMANGGQIAQGAAAGVSELAGALSMVSARASQATSDLNAAVVAMRQFHAAEAESMRNLAEAERNTSSFIEEQERRNALTAEQLELEDRASQLQSEAGRAGGILPKATADHLAAEQIAAEQRRAEAAKAAREALEAATAGSSGGGGGGGGGGGRSSAIADAEREREAVTRLIEQLQFERSTVGLSDIEKEKANALRRAGASATAEQKAQIEALVVATYEENEAIQANEQALESLRSVSKDVLSGMFEDLREGADAAEVLSNALNRVAEALASAAIDSLISSVFGGGGGSGGIGSAIASAFGKKSPGFAHGGSFTVGGTGGIDSQMVAFRATPGERVDIRTPGQMRSATNEGGVTINQNYSFATGVDASAMRAEGERIKRETIAAITRARRESKTFLA